MRPKTGSHSVSVLFCAVLLFLFAGCSLLLVSLGARIYQNGADHLEENYTVRTAIAYVSEQVRQHEEDGCISMQTLDGLPALRLESDLEGDRFYTFIYYDNGALRELFLRADTEPSADMGSVVVELAGCSITEHPDGFFSVTATGQNGSTLSALLYPVSR